MPDTFNVVQKKYLVQMKQNDVKNVMENEKLKRNKP